MRGLQLSQLKDRQKGGLALCDPNGGLLLLRMLHRDYSMTREVRESPGIFNKPLRSTGIEYDYITSISYNIHCR